MNDTVLDAGLGGRNLDFLNEINRDNCMGTGRTLIHESCCDRPVIGTLLNFFGNFLIIVNWVFIESLDINS